MFNTEHKDRNICSWNIRETFLEMLPVYSEKIPNEIPGNIPK